MSTDTRVRLFDRALTYLNITYLKVEYLNIIGTVTFMPVRRNNGERSAVYSAGGAAVYGVPSELYSRGLYQHTESIQVESERESSRAGSPDGGGGGFHERRVQGRTRVRPTFVDYDDFCRRATDRNGEGRFPDGDGSRAQRRDAWSNSIHDRVRSEALRPIQVPRAAASRTRLCQVCESGGLFGFHEHDCFHSFIGYGGKEDHVRPVGQGDTTGADREEQIVVMPVYVYDCALRALGAMLKIANNHQIARDSTMADVHQHPGPYGFQEFHTLILWFLFAAVYVFSFIRFDVFFVWFVVTSWMIVFVDKILKNHNSTIVTAVVVGVFRAAVFSLPMYVFITQTEIIKNLHKLAYSSDDADVEKNPGPAFNDNARVNALRSTLGMALQAYDVRCVLAAHGIPPERIDFEITKAVSAADTAKYYQTRTSQPLTPSGSAVQNVAKAFRAVYYGSVRDDYLMLLVAQYPPKWDCIKLLAMYPMHSEVYAAIARYLRRHQPSSTVPTLLLTDGTDVGDDPVSQSGPTVEKEFCQVCSFFVNPVGHDQRCRPHSSFALDDDVKRDAWIGDALHTLDVRKRLVSGGMWTARLSIACDAFKSGEAQAAYLRIRGFNNEYSERLQSDRTLSTLFEAHYETRYRTEYLVWLDEELRRLKTGEPVRAATSAQVEATWFFRA